MRTIYWQQLDIPGLERLVIAPESGGIEVAGTVIGLEDGGFRLDHRWRLNADWRPVAVTVERWGQTARKRVALEYGANGWTVDGHARPDLTGADLPDLSVTPFCNALPLRRMLASGERTITCDVTYVDGATLTVSRSRQAYDRLGPTRFLYRDLGLSNGFEAELEVEPDGMVRRYSGLFEMVEPDG